MERAAVMALMQPGVEVPSLARLLGRPAWQARAACRSMGPAIFVLDLGEQPGPALAICRRCTVRAECLDFALRDPHLAGVWGGTLPGERRAMRREAQSSPGALCPDMAAASI